MPEKSVLIIDDDATLVESIRNYLQSAGLKVHAAFDGPQGVAAASQQKPDVILLDFRMPAGGGATVYERLRNAPDTCRIPIIFTSAAPLQEIEGHVRPGPDTYFLKKPVSLAHMARVLRKVIDAEKGLDSGIRDAGELVKRNRTHEFAVRVTYADTDKMGISYYANYFKYFETGRTELLRSLGVRYRDLEAEKKLYLPAVEANCRYLGPSRYDDLLIVRTWLSSLGQASVSFEHEIYDRDSADRLVARGYSRHAVVNERWRPLRIPQELRVLLEPFVKA